MAAAAPGSGAGHGSWLFNLFFMFHILSRLQSLLRYPASTALPLTCVAAVVAMTHLKLFSPSHFPFRFLMLSIIMGFTGFTGPSEPKDPV